MSSKGEFALKTAGAANVMTSTNTSMFFFKQSVKVVSKDDPVTLPNTA